MQKILQEIRNLTTLGFYLNGAISDGVRPPAEKVIEHIEKGTLAEFLKSELREFHPDGWKQTNVPLDPSLFDEGLLSVNEIIGEEWRGFLDIDEDRKLAVVRNHGLCLLVAYIFQSINQRTREITE